MTKGRRFLRALIRIVLGIFALIFLVFALLQLPAAQQFLARKVVDVARNQLNTDLGLERLRIHFFNSVSVENFYLNNPEGDTIARLGEMSVSIDLLELASTTVDISSVRARDLYLNLNTTDSISNFAFLLGDTLTLDTTTLSADTTAASPWQIVLSKAVLDVENADVFFRDDPAGILVDAEVGLFKGATNSVDLTTGTYDIDRLDVKQVKGAYRQRSVTATEPSEAPPFHLLAGRVTLEEIDLTVDVDSVLMDIGVPYANLEGATFDLLPDLRFVAENFQLRNGDFTFDAPVPEMNGPGMDYNHVWLSGITTEATDIAYVVDSLHLNLRQLAATEKSGLQINRSEGSIIYTPKLLVLDDFLLRTPRTEINSPSTRVNYAFDGSAPPETLAARFGLNGYLGFRDVALLAPAFRDIPIIGDNLDKRLSFTARADGTGRSVDVDRLLLKGPGISVEGRGEVEYPFDMSRLSANFYLNELNVRPAPILPLVPDSLLPPGIDWPNRIVAEGRFEYGDDAISLDLFALEDRPNPLGLSSRIRAEGGFVGLTTYPASRIDLRADTLLATRPTLLAYLPPNLLPPGYRIPDYLRGSGKVVGPLDGTLDVDLQLYLPGENTFASLVGSITRPLDPTATEINLELRDLALASIDVKSIIPDTLLPANFNLPEFRVRNARVSGSFDDLNFELPLETSNGTWNLKGRYNPEDLNVEAELENFVLSELFTGAYRDSLETLELEPLSLQASVTGSLEPELDLQFTVVAKEENRGQILEMEGLAQGNTYSGDLRLTHPDFMAEGSALYSMGEDSVAVVFADLELDRVDLQRWDITERPLILSGHLVADVVGLDPYAMDADVLFDEVLLRGEDGSSYVDSLSVLATLFEEDNEIIVRSDVLDADLNGRFDPLGIADEFSRFLRGYWEEGVRQPDPMVNGKRLNFSLNVKRTRPLTGGLVNGLEELAPFSAEAAYRDAEPGLLASARLPHMLFNGLLIDDLVIKATGDVDKLNFRADFADINFNDQLVLGRTELTGDNVKDGILAEVKVFTTEDSLRHRLRFSVDPETDSLQLRLAETQIINFQPWRVPATNLIAIVGPSLLVRDFALAYEDQRLAAESTDPGDVEVTFDNFELSTVSRLLNSEENLASGTLNGRAGLDNVLTNLGLNTELTISELAILGTPMGTLEARVTTPDERIYRIDADLEGAGNRTFVDGDYVLNGEMDLAVNVERLTLASAEPFSLGFLLDSEGYLTGDLRVTGTALAPRINGDARFREGAFRISLLGEKFRLGEEVVSFDGSLIRIPELSVIDSRGGRARLGGTVRLNALDDIQLDLNARANDFLALNSTRQDNALYYGTMRVNADVTIEGTADLPVMVINASPAGESEVTYVYTVAQNRGLVNTQSVIDEFINQLEWNNVIRNEGIRDTVSRRQRGIDLTLNMSVDPDLLVHVIVDPISGQTFSGRATGDLTLRQFPDERQEMVGRVELVNGTYDFVFQNVLRRQFDIIAGSNVIFDGDILNPRMDLRIRHEVRTTPLPLVTTLDPQADNTGLRRRQTFFVRINLRGDLQSANIQTDITYPENATGNLGIDAVSDALQRLRQDQSRITTTAFSLLAFQSFNVPVLDGAGGGGVGLEQTTLDRLMGQTLNNLANQYLGFVELDFGLESYETVDGGTNTNLRLSLSKSLFNDRLVVSVDGVAGTDEDVQAGNGQTYLDNITAEYLLDQDGDFRLKIFNDRDRDVLVGGNVIRFGGRLTFSKEFDRIRWSSKDN